jgi:rubrerythrin
VEGHDNSTDMEEKMSQSIKGTETEKNLLKSFAGESQARTRYTYFASIAKKEDYVQIADIFEETANQEKEHAKRFFKFLEGGDLEITAMYPAEKWERQQRTFWQQQTVKMRNTLSSIPLLPKLP